tara:strand:- start:140 stop:391 length:252 start_codon:yes stop_codon:yes gene_type:complete
MKIFIQLARKFRDISPYFLLIAIYFLFINIEASRYSYKKVIGDNSNDISEEIDEAGNNRNIGDKRIQNDLLIKIKVIPYNDQK